jgi:hypothetical protein
MNEDHKDHAGRSGGLRRKLSTRNLGVGSVSLLGLVAAGGGFAATAEAVGPPQLGDRYQYLPYTCFAPGDQRDGSTRSPISISNFGYAGPRCSTGATGNVRIQTISATYGHSIATNYGTPSQRSLVNNLDHAHVFETTKLRSSDPHNHYTSGVSHRNP